MSESHHQPRLTNRIKTTFSSFPEVTHIFASTAGSLYPQYWIITKPLDRERRLTFFETEYNALQDFPDALVDIQLREIPSTQPLPEFLQTTEPLYSAE